MRKLFCKCAVLALTTAFAALCATAAEYDVTRYGARPDGATDNTAAIQKAIDDCSAKDDRRIFAWDLYNEPTFKIEEYADYSLELVRKSFRWAREVAPSQPLTVGTWNGNKKLEDLVHAESDIITFHCYGPADATRRKIAADSRMGRPVICTEWMMRNTGCTIQDVLGVYKETGVGCMLWGLVNGRTQTHVPNAKVNLDYKGPWVTDIFRPDHTPYDAREIELIKKATGRAP